MPRAKEKCNSRTFKLTKEADLALVNLKAVTGRTMTLVLEDLLLGRRQFSESIELWLNHETERTGLSRRQIIESAIEFYQRESDSPIPVASLNDLQRPLRGVKLSKS